MKDTPVARVISASGNTDWRTRLYRIPLANKILLANSAIVAVGAIAGTVITVRYVLRFPDEVPWLLISFFGGSGILISYLVNSWVLKKALAPLDRLQNAVDDVRAGKTDVTVQPGPISDERFDRLADTFNLMLEQLEDNALKMRQLSRLILQAQEAERLRLARELHDEAAQALTSLIVHLRLLERAKNPAEAQQMVVDLRELTARALDDVRRVSLDLRPTILDDLGLGPALEWRIDEFNRLDEVSADLSIHGLEHRLPADMELVFYRTGQEALSNIAKHSHASEVSVRLWTDEDGVHLEIEDNGCGFDPNVPVSASGSGLGLLGMRERLGMIGGELSIDSAPNQGCTIRASVPLPQANETPSTAFDAGRSIEMAHDRGGIL